MSDGSKPVVQLPSTHVLPARPFQYESGNLFCDGISLEQLAAEFDTPLYVYSARQIMYRYQLFEQAFLKQGHTVCYAVKANSSLAILALLGRQGAGFDIVSGGELERVRRACPEALKRVVFSGVGKQIWEIDAALNADILMFNVESEAELHLLARRADLLGVRARFSLRVNPDVFAETHPYISTGLRDHKFGVGLEKASALYQLGAKYPSLDAAGLSVHIGSQIRDVGPFGTALDRVAGLFSELRASGYHLRYIDVGGGLGVDYELSQDSIPPAVQMTRYADALRPALTRIGAHLLLEPGRFVLAQAGGLLTKVLSIKENGTKTFVIVDAAMNDLIRPVLYQAHHAILPVLQPVSDIRERVDVVGPVCESGDFLARDRELPRLKAGNLALLLDAGAYGMSLASNYNTRTRPAEILIYEGRPLLVRRRETLDDLFATESIPSEASFGKQTTYT